MKDHILRTKLQRPPVAPDILPRPRLLDRLNKGRQRTLTLISAPPGYGKSTLASRWVATCDSPTGWVSLDKNDSDLRMFLSYVLAAIRLLFPKAELRTEVFLEANQLPSVPVLARHLLNDLHQVTKPFILVLDDYHYIQETLVHDLLTEVLAFPPQVMHLVLLTRRDPALPISRLRGRGQVTEIRAADLRFTPAEAAAFLKDKLKIPVDDATAALLDEKTEGWVTGLRLAGLYLRDQEDLKHRVQELSGRSGHIAEYLVGEVLSSQDPEIAAFLVETSILDRFCAPLCQAVHSRGVEGRSEKRHLEAHRFIEWLVEANIFVIPLDDQGYWYRYHHLFREFLQALLRKQTNADIIARLHVEASNWYAENDLIDEAISHALAAGDAPAAVRLVIEHRYELMNTEQWSRLRYWLSLLPADIVANDPLLTSTKVHIATYRGQNADLIFSLRRAEKLLADLVPGSEIYETVQSEIGVVYAVQDVVNLRPVQAVNRAQSSLKLLSQHALYMRAMAIGVTAVGLQMQGDLERGVAMIRGALAEHGWPDGLRAKMMQYLCTAFLNEGDLLNAFSSARTGLRITEKTSAQETLSFCRYHLGLVHYLWDEFPQAESHLQALLDDRAAAAPLYLANGGFVLALIRQAQGRIADAVRVIDLLENHFQETKHSHALAFIGAFQVELTLRNGNLAKALLLSKSVELERGMPIWFFFVPQLTPIKLLLAEGTDEGLKEARTRLAKLDKQMGRMNRKSVRIDVLALLALVCAKQGEQKAALEKLRAALALAEPGGFIRNLVDLGAGMTDLLERLVQVQPGHDYAEKVLEACRAEVQRKSASSPGANKASHSAGHAPASILTRRETELLTLLAEGLSNKEIAARLYIATETVKTHLRNIYGKLDAEGRIKALKKARALGLITRDD